VLGLGCALGAMGFVFGLGRSVARIGAAGEDGRLGGREALHALLAGFAGALALAYSTPIAIWAMGGLEGSLVALGLAWALWDSFAAMRLVRDGDEARGLRRARRAGIGLALLVWTRPDGALFGLSMALGYLVGCGWRLGWRMTWRSAGYPVAALVLLTGLRLVYYGEWLPNTAHVKAEFSFEAFRLGGEYVLSGLGWLGAGVVGALLSLGFDRERRAYAAALLFHMLLTCLYVAAIQGDFFPGRRQLLPLALLGAVGVGLFTAHPVNRLMRFFLSFAPAGLLIMWLIYGVNGDPQAQRARKEFWVRDSIALGEQLQQMFGEERPVLAVEAAGALPFAVDFECIDMLGLNDRHIARLDARSGAIPGHNHADGGYVIGREPDLIGFLSPPMMLVSAYPSWFDLTVLPEFAEGYRPFAVQVPGRKDTVLWVRYLGRLGVRERGEGAGYRYEIPPYLFGAPDPMPAVANGILSHGAAECSGVALDGQAGCAGSGGGARGRGRGQRRRGRCGFAAETDCCIAALWAGERALSGDCGRGRGGGLGAGEPAGFGFAGPGSASGGAVCGFGAGCDVVVGGTGWVAGAECGVAAGGVDPLGLSRSARASRWSEARTVHGKLRPNPKPAQTSSRHPSPSPVPAQSQIRPRSSWASSRSWGVLIGKKRDFFPVRDTRRYCVLRKRVSSPTKVSSWTTVWSLTFFST
jgi:arabinofuranosyltransferase